MVSLIVLLGGNMSSRLFIKLRENEGLIYSVHAEYEDYSDIGSISIECGTFGDKKSIFKCIRIILHELQLLKKDKVSAKELKHNKNYYNGNFLLDLEDSTNLAVMHSENILLRNKVETYDEIKKKINKVTSDEIQKVANKIFQKDKCNIAIISKEMINRSEINKLVDEYL